MDICKRIQMLPVVIVSIIQEYIPFIVVVFIDKSKYIQYHEYIMNKMIHYRAEKYMRFVIRNDLDFVFSQIYKKRIQRWINTKKYLYKDIVYYNYLSFILYFIMENNSNKCNQLLNEHLIKVGISKKLYKNNTFINKRWKI